MIYHFLRSISHKYKGIIVYCFRFQILDEIGIQSENSFKPNDAEGRLMGKWSVVYSPTCEGSTLSQSTTLSTIALSCTVLLDTIGSLEMSLKFRIWLQITNFIWKDLLPWMKSTLSYNFNQLKKGWNQKLIRNQSTLIKLNFHSINQSYIF